MNVRTFAAIDVGSFEITMKIYEFSGKKSMKVIDSLTRRLPLGADTYASGRISSLRITELCQILSEYAGIMKSYHVESYRAYATSAIRETDNSSIVLDIIRQRTGIVVSVLSNSEQRFLDYKSVASHVNRFNAILEESTAILDIGGGSIQISLFDRDTLVSTQNLRLGVLRIRERIGSLNPGREQFESLIEELAGAQLEPYRKLYLRDRQIRNLIVVDDYISSWAAHMDASDSEGAIITAENFDGLREVLRSHSKSELASMLDLADEQIPLLHISTILTTLIESMMQIEKIWIPGVSLCDGIAYEFAEQKKLLAVSHDFERDIVACATNISKRYNGSRKRASTLIKISETVFESMKKVHGLGKREKLYLDIAAILHDCGKYISLNNIGERSYDIVMATEIIGLSHKERAIVANIVRFNHTDFDYDEISRSGELSDADLLTVAKLTAILRLANTLDRSHKQKAEDIRSSLSDQQLRLSVDSDENLMLEQAFFEECADFFEEVYGVRPVLKVRHIQ